MSPLTDHRPAYVCSHVFEGKRPVLFVSRDEGDWQFLCGGSDHQDEIPHVIGFSHLLERDSSLHLLADLPEGCEAERATPEGSWQWRAV